MSKIIGSQPKVLMEAADKIFASPFLGFLFCFVFSTLGFWETTRRDRKEPAYQGQHEKIGSFTAAIHIYDLYVTILRVSIREIYARIVLLMQRCTSTIVNNRSPTELTKLVWLGGKKSK
uniref:Uncharacterized protein n=1 Tax=Micrurus lemniscatus lemniscatus TaxID=129467 RepID=A0A2D4ICE9_MICLE